jgi:signal transduction histidine kinase
MSSGEALGATRYSEAGYQLLLRLSAALARGADTEVVVRTALDALVAEFGATSAALFFVDEEAGVSRLTYSVNYPAEVHDLLREVSLTAPALSNLALSTGEVQVIRSPEALPPGMEVTRGLGERMGIQSAAAVPLLAGGRRLGVIVYGLAQPYAFTDDDIALLREVGDRVAIALERSRLEEALARRAEEAELLHAIALAASGEDDLERILLAALDRLRNLMAFTGGSIALVEGDELVLRAAAGPFSAVALGQRLPRSRGRSWRIVETGEPFYSPDLAADGLRSLSSDGDRIVRSYLAVPLVWRGAPFGVLQVDSTEPHAFHPSDINLLQRVATLLSGPIELARRYAAEVQLRHDLAETKGRLEAILAHAPMGILFFDRDDCLAYANPVVYETVQLLPSDELLLGRSWDELGRLLAERRWAGDPDDLVTLINDTRQLRDGLFVVDLPLRAPDQLLLRIAAPVFEGGELSGHVILLIDVTNERRALADAERAIALRDRFISIASHELRTPLTSIKGVAQLLLRLSDAGLLTEEVLARQLATIDGQADRLRRLIEELLDVSRIQAGRLELRREAADLAALVRNAVETLPEESRERVRVTAEPSVPGHWDTLRIEQVVMNLLDNALKYSPADTPVVVRVTQAGHEALLSVSDRGIGIPAADQRDLLQPFARASNAATRNEGGLGLGLYITRQIVERHGGTLDVASIEGQGSTFTVRLPM